MLLENITPIILTYNEENNIGRTLDCLTWARNIVVVDSFSNDKTMEIVKRYPNVRIFQRKFDDHTTQWNYALKETAVKTEWVFTLDADYIISREVIGEIERLAPPEDINGYFARFDCAIYGRKISSFIYPPRLVLFRKDRCAYVQDGHTQLLRIAGLTAKLGTHILHDDRKSLERWITAQAAYAVIEAELIHKTPFFKLNWPDRIRKLPFLAPGLMFFYCYILRGGIFDGYAGLFYAYQRFLAEAILSLYLLRYFLTGRL